MTIRLKVRAAKPIQDIVFGVAIFNESGTCCVDTNTHLENLRPVLPGAEAEVSVALESLDLLAGTYKLDVAAHARNGSPYDYHRLLTTFVVFGETATPGVHHQRHRWTFSPNVRFES